MSAARFYLSLTLCLICIGLPAQAIRVEPQLAPWRIAVIVPSSSDPEELLVLEDDEVSLWSFEDERPVRLLTLETPVHDGAMTPDGKIIVLGRDGRVRCWNRDGDELWTLERHHANGNSFGLPRLAMGWNPKRGQGLLAVTDEELVRLWNLDGSPYGGFPVPDGQIEAMAFSPDGRILATAGKVPELRLWNLDGSPRGEPFQGPMGEVDEVAFSPDGQSLASVETDGTLRLWNLDGSPRSGRLEGHEARIRSLSFSPDGQALVTTDYNRVVQFWSLDGARLSNPLEGHQADSVVFAPDGETLISTANSEIRFWSVDGSPRDRFLKARNDARVLAVASSPGGEMLATGWNDGTVQLWNLDGTPRGEPFMGHEGGVSAVDFSPKGRMIATGGADGTVRLWNLDGSPVGQAFEGHGKSPFFDSTRVGVVTFAPHGQTLYSVGDDLTYREWKLDGSRVGGRLIAEDFVVSTLDFSPKGDLFATNSDAFVQLWNMDGTPLTSLDEHVTAALGSVVSLAFAPDGRSLAASEYLGGMVHLYDLAAGSEPHLARSIPAAALQLGFVRSLPYTALQSGHVTIFSQDWQPRAHLYFTPEGGLAFTEEGWFSGSSELLQQVRHFPGAGQPALDPGESLDRYHRPREVLATIRSLSSEESLSEGLWSTNDQFPWWKKVTFWPTALVLFTLLLLVLLGRWIFRPEARDLTGDH